MAEKQGRDWMEELLVQAGGTLDYPPTPDIVSAVRARLAGREERQSAAPGAGLRSRAWFAPVAAAVVTLTVAGALTLAASRGARHAVADFLGLRVAGEEISIIPTPRTGETPTAPPPTRDIASYATPVAMAAMSSALGFEPALPAGSSQPDATYLVDYQGMKAGVLQYGDFDLWELRLPGGVVGKGLPFFTKETRVLEEVSVNGQPAYWISGGGHIVRFVNAGGTVVAGSERTVERNTLIWQSASGTNYRLETELSKDEALALAKSLP
ncbi:MAG TPA: hypothetical protein VFY90_03070 [Tepidiformaceae bacterium]|nr:hypothetical protein [Tepidiformaceae bacterium]